MISVCIPVYNTNVTTLIYALDKQASAASIRYEIILLDDASTNIETREANQELLSINNLKIYNNEQNIGLARTRNKLARLAQYPYLLFIDSDAEVIRPDYFETYTSLCKPNTVYFGGCAYTDSCPRREYILRWKFGKKREEGVGKYFSCFNFLIPKEIFNKHSFSENLNQYGYEDTLFGITLKHNAIDVQFIDNPLLHTGLDTALQYLNKVELSIQNLIKIEPLLKDIKEVDSIRLLKLYNSINRLSLTKSTALLFKISRRIITANLRSNSPFLFSLDFYKLGYLCSLKTKK